MLKETNWQLAVPAIAGMAALHLIGAACWRVLVRRLTGTDLPWLEACKSYYAAQAIGGLTPGNVGGDAYRVFALTHDGGSILRASLPVLVQRITSTLVLLGAGVAGAVLIGLRWDWRPSPGLIAAVALAVAVTAILVWRTAGWWSRGVVALAERSALEHQRLAGGFGAGLLFGVMFHFAALGLSLVLVWSLLPGIPVLETLACLAVARLAIALPISPNGLGFQEGALAVLFPHIGLASEVALAVSLLGRVSLLLTMGTGLALIVSGQVGKLRSPAVATRDQRLPASRSP